MVDCENRREVNGKDSGSCPLAISHISIAAVRILITDYHPNLEDPNFRGADVDST
jgi:hypothetical protein